MLDAGRITGACGNPEQYDEQINAWYEMVLQDENEEIQYHAADSLFGFYLRKKEYVAAEKYLNYFSEHDPMKKIFRARLYKEQGKSWTVAHTGSAADISGGDRRVGGSFGRYEGISS